MEGLRTGQSDLVRLRSCVRPVLRGTLSAGPYGFRDAGTNGLAALRLYLVGLLDSDWPLPWFSASRSTLRADRDPP